jgi:hypothetical protein
MHQPKVGVKIYGMSSNQLRNTLAKIDAVTSHSKGTMI